MQAVYAAAGPTAVVRTKPDTLRQAVSEVSIPARTTVTRDFGWDPAGTCFRAPSVVVTADGVRPAGPADPVRVDLAAQDRARLLDLAALDPGRLAAVKRLVADDLVRLNDPQVTLPLLGVAALAVLERFAPDAPQRFALWLRGLTGSGKTFLARLFQSFFGRFHGADGVTGWTSTANFVEQQGHYFANAVYVVDDYKPETVRPEAVMRVLQNYADRSGRGRLHADATAQTTRPIRGLLVATGEDTVDSSASGLARVLVVDVPAPHKDLGRAHRCQQAAADFPGLTADLVRHCLAAGETARFNGRYLGQYGRLFGQAGGRANDGRVAGNAALLAAALGVAADYFRPDLPAFAAEVDADVATGIPALMMAQLEAAGDAQEGRTFVRTLGALVQHGHVQITNLPSHGSGPERPSRPCVGRVSPRDSTVALVSMPLALAEVNASLLRQGRPGVRLSMAAMIRQLAQNGLLVAPSGQPEGLRGEHTHSTRLDGKVQGCVGFRLADLCPDGVAAGPAGIPF